MVRFKKKSNCDSSGVGRGDTFLDVLDATGKNPKGFNVSSVFSAGGFSLTGSFIFPAADPGGSSTEQKQEVNGVPLGQQETKRSFFGTNACAEKGERHKRESETGGAKESQVSLS